MAGGYVAYYYTYTAWDVVRPQDTPPGYAYFRRVRDFFESTRYWELEPASDVASAGWCLADPGKEYVVFLNQAVPLTLKLSDAAGSLQGEWYQPFSGQRISAGRLANGHRELTPPTEWGQGPVTLHVRGAARAD